MNNTRRLSYEDYDLGDYLIPKELLQNEKYKGLDSVSVLLYSILLDELTVSADEGMYDDAGCLYVMMNDQSMCELLSIGISKLINIKNQLLEYDLIEIEKSNLENNNRIFPKKPTRK